MTELPILRPLKQPLYDNATIKRAPQIERFALTEEEAYAFKVLRNWAFEVRPDLTTFIFFFFMSPDEKRAWMAKARDMKGAPKI
jgi:hypothetical protein